MRGRPTPFKVAWAIMILVLAGWKPRYGYSLAEQESDGSRFFSVWLDPPQ